MIFHLFQKMKKLIKNHVKMRIIDLTCIKGDRTTTIPKFRSLCHHYQMDPQTIADNLVDELGSEILSFDENLVIYSYFTTDYVKMVLCVILKKRLINSSQPAIAEPIP